MRKSGRVRLKAAVPKTAGGKTSVGSNPTSSSTLFCIFLLQVLTNSIYNEPSETYIPIRRRNTGQADVRQSRRAYGDLSRLGIGLFRISRRPGSERKPGRLVFTGIRKVGLRIAWDDENLGSIPRSPTSSLTIWKLLIQAALAEN